MVNFIQRDGLEGEVDSNGVWISTPKTIQQNKLATINGMLFALDLYSQVPNARSVVKAWLKDSPDVVPVFNQKLEVSREQLDAIKLAVVEDRDNVDSPLDVTVGEAIIQKLDEIIQTLN